MDAPPIADMIRVSVLMSQRGLCSKREAADYIKGGKVTVNGEVVTDTGAKVCVDQKDSVDIKLSTVSYRLPSLKVSG